MQISRETVAIMIDVFEDFLEKKGISIENNERTGDEGEAIIYGSDFDELMSGLSDTLGKIGIHISEQYDNDVALPKKNDDDLIIFVPAYGEVIRIQEGSGCNLDKADYEEGYVDYINYSIYNAAEIENGLEEIDGGMLMMKEYVRDKYSCLQETVADVLDLAYTGTDKNINTTWVELSPSPKFKEAD